MVAPQSAHTPAVPEVAASCAMGSVKEVVSRYLVRSENEVDLETVAMGVLDFAMRGVVQGA